MRPGLLEHMPQGDGLAEAASSISSWAGLMLVVVKHCEAATAAIKDKRGQTRIRRM